jgi:hypothetical protein
MLDITGVQLVPCAIKDSAAAPGPSLAICKHARCHSISCPSACKVVLAVLQITMKACLMMVFCC